MGTTEKIKLDRIIGIFEAVTLVEENKLLSGTIAYRVGRLGDRARSIVRTFEKQRTRLRRDVMSQLNDLKSKAETAEDSEKKKIEEAISELNNSFNQQIEEMMDNEEEIKIPQFSMNDFLASEDIKEKVGDKMEVTVKTGQPLVPIKFFTLMGDIIKE